MLLCLTRPLLNVAFVEGDLAFLHLYDYQMTIRRHLTSQLAQCVTLYGNLTVVLRRLCGYHTVASRGAFKTVRLTYGRREVALRSLRDFHMMKLIKCRWDTLQFANTYAVDRKAARFPSIHFENRRPWKRTMPASFVLEMGLHVLYTSIQSKYIIEIALPSDNNNNKQKYRY